MVNMLKILGLAIVILIIFVIVMKLKFKQLFIFRSAKPLHEESKWLELITTTLVIVMAFAHYWINEPEASIVMWLGAVIFMGGWILQFFARKQLGAFITLDQKLQTGFTFDGMYKKIRHPSKTGLIVILLGLCLALGSWWALGILIVFFIPSLIYKIIQEEQTLIDKYDKDWQAYSNDTNRLIPGVY
ncbi:hypothetical protein COV18_06980 [Candidatus Woesearchaeota archaeon CG10_big_fil_rev_8_21_14_0_10_37_12]|nr:MAG: hypothetical protein COV18_06980 [Candidatus Woesearchaeota archaeon CG10_big_fil_rev_8_21_14_0_10_37_12]